MSSFAYRVDLDLARDVVCSLARVDADLMEVVTDLRWRVARLHEAWAGTAAGAHLSAHGEWEASYAEMREALTAMRGAVHRASSSYAAAAEANASMWSALR